MISTMKRTISLAILAASAALAGAECWTLDSCVSYALSHNLNVKNAMLQVERGRQELESSRDAFLPTLDAGASESFNFGRGLTAANTYADRNTSSFSWNASAGLPLFQASMFARNKVAKASLQQLVLESEAARDNITLNIISLYMQVLFCREVEQSALSQASLSAYQVDRVRAMVESGKLAEAELYDVESQAAQDSLTVVTSHNDTRIALVNLANMLMLRDIDSFDVADIDMDIPVIPRPEQVFRDAMNVNSSIRSSRQAIKVADENISLARTGYLPTLSFNAGLGSSYYKISGMPNDAFGDQMRHNYSTYLGFSLRVPIFDGFSTRNSIRSAKLQRHTAQLQLDQQENQLFTDIQLAYTQAIGARQSFLTSKTTLEKTELSFNATRERYDLGRATATDFEQAKNNLFITRVNHIRAHYEYLLRFRILHFYQTNSL